MSGTRLRPSRRFCEMHLRMREVEALSHPHPEVRAHSSLEGPRRMGGSPRRRLGAGSRPCMTVRLKSISVSISPPPRMAALVSLEMKIDREMIEARKASGKPLSGLAQSAAKADQTRRFQSSASARLRISRGVDLLHLHEGAGHLAESRYSVERGSSARALVR
jgi:hypothetical protein